MKKGGKFPSVEEKPCSVSIRFCRLHKILYDAVVREGMHVRFQKRVTGITEVKGSHGGNAAVDCAFADGTRFRAAIVFAADGSDSTAREIVARGYGVRTELQYTGIACLTGISTSQTGGGVSDGDGFLAKCTARFHGCFFPSGEGDGGVCFQFHFPSPAEEDHCGDADGETMLPWEVLGAEEGRRECKYLALRLVGGEEEGGKGWDQDGPLVRALLSDPTGVMRIRFRALRPGLSRWSAGQVVLLGDAAHPSIPYVGQGPSLAVEDAGALSYLMGGTCLKRGEFNLSPENFGLAVRLYEEIRMPRTSPQILNDYNFAKNGNNFGEEGSSIFRVYFQRTLPAAYTAPLYNLKKEVESMIKGAKEKRRHTRKTTAETARKLGSARASLVHNKRASSVA